MNARKRVLQAADCGPTLDSQVRPDLRTSEEVYVTYLVTLNPLIRSYVFIPYGRTYIKVTSLSEN
jgi:hypothetical protein